jgi:hypothetical protein
MYHYVSEYAFGKMYLKKRNCISVVVAVSCISFLRQIPFMIGDGNPDDERGKISQI